MKSVVVFDYGFGNVRSMMRALANQHLDVTLTSDYRASLEADGLVVPGVCVGEQIMFDRGTEHDLDTQGLQLINGKVERLDADVIPHMGWDTVEAPANSILLNGVEDERFYFVHSYAAFDAQPADCSQFSIDFGDAEQRVGYCQYSRSRFVASYERGPLFATQFHPEKSAQAGGKLLANWAAIL